jgi:GT2 family glycosyltransferase
LKRLLDTAYEKTKEIYYEIVITDNSEDDKSSFFQENYPDIKYINNRINLGFSRAVNIGIRQCAGKYILLLNPDTRLKNNAAMILARYLDDQPDVGIVGSKILNNNGSVQFSCRSFPSYKTAFFNRYSLLTKLFPKNKYSNEYFNPVGSHDKPIEVDWLSGSCMMIRKQALDTVGLFDENFFMYCEDVDICRRMKSHGWKVVYYPHAVVYHSIGLSSAHNKIQTTIERHKSMWVYYKKHLRHYKIVDIIIWLGILVRCIFQVILTLFTKFRN